MKPLLDMDSQTSEELKAKQNDQWAHYADAYSRYVLDGDFFPAVRQQFVDSLPPLLQGRASLRILDVASASGEPAISLARALPQAEVVSTDLAETYPPLGRARAARAGVGNTVSFETADGEDLRQFADASFDVVTCSLGLMFFPSEDKGLREFSRVLKPSGILAATVWAGSEHVPSFTVPLEVAAHMDASIAKNSNPNTATRFGGARGLLDSIAAAGFVGVEARAFDVEFRMPGGGEWWMVLLKIPFPLAKAIAAAHERGNVNAEAEARGLLEAAFRQRGYFQPDGSVLCPGNRCHYIMAHVPAAALLVGAAF